MIVVDTNLVAYLLLPGEHTALAERVLERDSDWAAPFLWRSELRNVLAVQYRRGLLGREAVSPAMTRAETLLRGREFLPSSTLVLQLAMETRRTAYDCEFVAVPEELGVKLITSDRALVAAFPDRAVTPETFLTG